MQSELIVLSHLRWDWVWQRPQHLVSRLGSRCSTWYVEEPLTPFPGFQGENRMNHSRVDGLNRAWLEIPDKGRHVGFVDDVLPDYIDQLPELVGPPAGERVVWLYTPLALELALALKPTTLVYDVMDDLAAFKDAPPELVVRQRQTLRRADVVFAGGRSLYRSMVRQGRPDTLLFPSGVEPEHYRCPTPSGRVPGQRPVAGYVGVLDERLDLGLIGGLARALPEWDIRMYGPVAKIDPASLPQAPNISYLGYTSYADLPAAMAGLDVALMPFALNEATRSISPTKTLEYLAAGLPVVSTRVPDVVADFPDTVHLRDDAIGFASLCRQLGQRDPSRGPNAATRELLKKYHWDAIAARMAGSVFAARLPAPEPVGAEASA
ncbi:glycosyltransferase [Arthrobacter sp. Cr_A7]|uniref:glycosyltransferase n=1 Tax=Arthrobacter sp. Cr_A7 TaxID=3031017 RepID=UPI0023DAA660|nr:glycosyltransferase [Arthrobacter sp. Cr_A7]MDF2050905.1 glycosyltransferase [Arthrobacter sp. Cr_A7]